MLLMDRLAAQPFTVIIANLTMLAFFILWPALIGLALVFAGIRIIKGIAKTNLMIPCFQALFTGAVVIGIALALTYSLIWTHILPHNLRDISTGEVFSIPLIIFIQAVMLLLAGIFTAAVRGKYNRTAGILTGVLLVCINISPLTANWFPQKIFGLMYGFLFPLLASVPLWWPGRNKHVEQAVPGYPPQGVGSPEP